MIYDSYGKIHRSKIDSMLADMVASVCEKIDRFNIDYLRQFDSGPSLYGPDDRFIPSTGSIKIGDTIVIRKPPRLGTTGGTAVK